MKRESHHISGRHKEIREKKIGSGGETPLALRSAGEISGSDYNWEGGCQQLEGTNGIGFIQPRRTGFIESTQRQSRSMQNFQGDQAELQWDDLPVKDNQLRRCR